MSTRDYHDWINERQKCIERLRVTKDLALVAVGYLDLILVFLIEWRFKRHVD